MGGCVDAAFCILDSLAPKIEESMLEYKYNVHRRCTFLVWSKTQQNKHKSAKTARNETSAVRLNQ